MSVSEWVTEKVTDWIISRATPDIIEIGAHSFRRIRGTFQSGRFFLKELAITQAPKMMVFSPYCNIALFDPEEFKEAISRLFDGKIPKDSFVAIILPDQGFHFGFVSIPAFALKGNLGASIEREFQITAPMPLKEYHLLFDFSPPKGKTCGVLYCAIPIGVRDEILSTFEELSLIPVSIHPSFICQSGIVKTLDTESSPHPAIWIHLGQDTTTVGIFLAGGLKRVQNLPIGAYDLTIALMKKMNISRAKAEAIKHNEVILLDEPLSEAQIEIEPYKVLEPVLGKLLQKIYGVLQLHAVESPQEGAFRRIFLSGCGGNLSNMENLIASNLGIPVTKAGNLIECTTSTGIVSPEVKSQISGSLGAIFLQTWRKDRLFRMTAA